MNPISWYVCPTADLSVRPFIFLLKRLRNPNHGGRIVTPVGLLTCVKITLFEYKVNNKTSKKSEQPNEKTKQES